MQWSRNAHRLGRQRTCTERNESSNKILSGESTCYKSGLFRRGVWIRLSPARRRVGAARARCLRVCTSTPPVSRELASAESSGARSGGGGAVTVFLVGRLAAFHRRSAPLVRIRGRVLILPTRQRHFVPVWLRKREVSLKSGTPSRGVRACERESVYPAFCVYRNGT